MKTKKRFIFKTLPMFVVMYFFLGFSGFSCFPNEDVTWYCTLTEFEAGAASRNPPKDTASAKSGGKIFVELQTPTEEDKLEENCFARIATVLSDNAGKIFSIDMRTCEFKDPAVTAVPEGAFENCKGQLSHLDLPPQITCIGKRAFAGFTGLRHIYIGAQIKEVGDEAFKDWNGSIFIPATVTTMGKNVFEGWTSEQTIYVPFAENDKPDGWDTDWNKNSDGTPIMAKIEYRQP